MFKSKANKPSKFNKQAREEQRVASQRSSIMSTLAISGPLTVAAWWGLYTYLPPIPGMTSELARLSFGLKAAGVTSFLTLALPAEGISHERLVSRSINPLAVTEPQTKRMAVNSRVMQNNLEQVVIFAPALVALAGFMKDGRDMRAVAASAIVFTASRGLYWLGYHVDPKWRAFGLAGSMVHSYALNIFVGAKFGFELAGAWGAAVVGSLFAVGELIVSLPLLVDAFKGWRKAKQQNSSSQH